MRRKVQLSWRYCYRGNCVSLQSMSSSERATQAWIMFLPFVSLPIRILIPFFFHMNKVASVHPSLLKRESRRALSLCIFTPHRHLRIFILEVLEAIATNSLMEVHLSKACCCCLDTDITLQQCRYCGKRQSIICALLKLCAGIMEMIRSINPSKMACFVIAWAKFTANSHQKENGAV